MKLVDLLETPGIVKYNKYRIFCDMDGVIVDFERGYEDLTGIHPSHKDLVKGSEGFWEPLTKAGAEFWANLPWMRDGKQLWSYIQKYKPNILSAPSQDPSSRLGKEEWIQNNLEGYDKVYFARRVNKQKFSYANTILIDDLKETIDEWNSREGISILHTSAQNTINELKKLGL